MKKLLYIAAALALLSLSGCATQYNFNGESYRSSTDALAAQKGYLDKLLAGVKSRGTSIDAKVLVVTPAPATIEALGIKRTGTPKQDSIDYMTHVSHVGLSVFC